MFISIVMLNVIFFKYLFKHVVYYVTNPVDDMSELLIQLLIYVPSCTLVSVGRLGIFEIFDPLTDFLQKRTRVF